MDKYEKLLSAVYFNDAETAIRLMETNDYPNKWLGNVLSMDIPIYYARLCCSTLSALLREIEGLVKLLFEKIRSTTLSCERKFERNSKFGWSGESQ